RSTMSKQEVPSEKDLLAESEKHKIHRHLVASRLEIVIIEDLLQKLDRRHSVSRKLVVNMETAIRRETFSSPNCDLVKPLKLFLKDLLVADSWSETVQFRLRALTVRNCTTVGELEQLYIALRWRLHYAAGEMNNFPPPNKPA
ncbi:hypothetical protein KI387_025842, partial [Taxus chinensis]